MSNFVAVSRNYTETNMDLSCRGYDIFQDCTFFHAPAVGLGKNMEEGPEKDAWMAKFYKKCTFFPTRALALLQPGRGRIILPRGNADVEKVWNFFRTTLGLNEDQIIWFNSFPGHSMEYDLMNDPDAVAQLQRIVDTTPENSDRRKLFIFSDRPELVPWAKELGLNVCYDTIAWRRIYGYKHILHSKPSIEKSFLEQILPDGVSVRVPRGYNCSTKEELLQAVELLKNSPGKPIAKVCLKPIGASDGDGIEFVALHDAERFSNYHFPMGDVAVEEKLLLDCNPDGTPVTVVTHYCGPHLLGPSCDQLIGSATSETAFIGNVYPSECPRPVRKKCETAVKAIMEASDPQGPGGMDFLFEGGEPYLVDINSGRFNGGMYPKAFHKQYASHQTAYVSFKTYSPTSSLEDCMRVIREKGWEFVPILPNNINPVAGEQGIFPLVHIPGIYGSYIAIAESRDECLRMKNEFSELNL